MTSFSQLGDPVCPVCPEPVECLCEHHGAVYASLVSSYTYKTLNLEYDAIDDGAVITQAQITTTERCCIVVNAATNVEVAIPASALEIERPVGTVRTMQEDAINLRDLALMHHAAWEVLDPGTYTYYLVNHSGDTLKTYAAWLKIIASDCEA